MYIRAQQGEKGNSHQEGARPSTAPSRPHQTPMSELSRTALTGCCLCVVPPVPASAPVPPFECWGCTRPDLVAAHFPWGGRAWCPGDAPSPLQGTVPSLPPYCQPLGPCPQPPPSISWLKVARFRRHQLPELTLELGRIAPVHVHAEGGSRGSTTPSVSLGLQAIVTSLSPRATCTARAHWLGLWPRQAVQSHTRRQLCSASFSSEP